MQRFALIFPFILLITIVIAHPIKKQASIHKSTARDKKLSFTAVPIKSEHDAYDLLTEFGYNPCEDRTKSITDNHNAPLCQTSIDSMLEKFQKDFRLTVTKKLDAATLKLMNTPRCNLPNPPQATTKKNKLW